MNQHDAFEELLRRNNELARTHQPLPDLKVALKPVRPGFIIISCSDPRFNPYKIFGLDASFGGRVTMIRNAGGRAIDAVRTISALQTIGAAKTILVVHHNDCGMSHYSDADIRTAMLKIAPEEEKAIGKFRYGEIDEGSIEKSLNHDVAFLRDCPFIIPGTQIMGLAYDIKTGFLTKVVEAER
ncbi:Uncharacterized protein Focb16_v005285 [Fusarium oxysporum f. sp. cubense]|uniref:Carbonic anhydrase n=1 Tax=Fusarium oxysporum f. sp. cubense TaxID=61366 RepID=A0A559LJM3_FUSOC|nr:Uncharacterized protein Focb16_v005285 [Fusarium oxysporum f. sp. cubense]